MEKNNEVEAKPTSRALKISEMISEFARYFIDRGKDIREKQKCLDVACAAWNISLYQEKGREKAIDDYVGKYEAENPDVDSRTVRALKEDMAGLIQKKLELFPDVNRLIIGAHITSEKGEDRISAASTLHIGF